MMTDTAQAAEPAPAAVARPANGSHRSIIDANDSRERKLKGQQIALDFSAGWRLAVVPEFRRWCAQQKAIGARTCTIEQFRADTKLQPESHKAWGAIVKAFVREGIIRPTDQYQRAGSRKTHAHPVRVWEFV
jgi:hypothetical protein